jgi:hypothetical protein
VQVSFADVTEQHRDRVGGMLCHQPAGFRRKLRDRRQWQGHIEFQRRPVRTEHFGDRFADLPESLLRGYVDADRGLI